uniref:Uncharacterized protein n=1 Tax=Rhizophora mucronata TaxID=61149 RepID=A0A2P2LXA6_RHIMU
MVALAVGYLSFRHAQALLLQIMLWTLNSILWYFFLAPNFVDSTKKAKNIHPNCMMIKSLRYI